MTPFNIPQDLRNLLKMRRAKEKKKQVWILIPNPKRADRESRYF
jgi:hypothetical protein